MRRKKTQQEFIDEVESLVGQEYEVLGEYINSATKIKMKHNSCGHIWDITPRHFINNNRRCPICMRKQAAYKRTKTTEHFKNEVEMIMGHEYEVLGTYINNKTPIRMKHNICGHIWNVTPSSFICNNTRCPKCAINIIIKKQVKTTEYFKNEVKMMVGQEYEVLGEYVNTHTKIRMRHNCDKCNNFEWEITPHDFLSGRRCRLCSNRIKTINQTKSYDIFVQDVFNAVGEEYSVIGTKYVNANTKIRMRHNVCGHIWDVKPSSFINVGSRCPICAIDIVIKKQAKTTEQFKKEIFDIVKDEYTVLGKYKNTNTKIKMKHNTCGHIWDVTPTHFISSNSRCPKCNEFKGEKAIDTFLSNNNFNYKIQYTFSDCKNKNPLRFDFAVFDENDNLKLLIEYQGIQHYKYIEFFHRDDAGFVKQILSDGKKRAYCEYNNIPLLEIFDKDIKNIETILKEKLLNIA